MDRTVCLIVGDHPEEVVDFLVVHGITIAGQRRVLDFSKTELHVMDHDVPHFARKALERNGHGVVLTLGTKKDFESEFRALRNDFIDHQHLRDLVFYPLDAAETQTPFFQAIFKAAA